MQKIITKMKNTNRKEKNILLNIGILISIYYVELSGNKLCHEVIEFGRGKFDLEVIFGQTISSVLKLIK
jgi:hypothetical protein